ncbi:peptidase family M19 protein [Nocardia nova SH22a]|uniref:Peptidase family M19 protein n=1 Tax=Nocardia nova SH22a TaxID=1415166 RepID=W5TSP0_9NOCA|nr:membrane dipeptidase [Nocardia nova]AHH21888.1 peptidase family M19 protein [Nocardia nova SH22a]
MGPALWEQHCCLPVLPSADVTELARYPAGSYVSVNVGYSLHSMADALAMIELLRRDALADGRFRLVRTFADTEVAAVGPEAAVALAFDLEDSRPLDGDLDNVTRFHDLGVRSLLPTYNHANAAGGGCLDTDDRGLTGYGRDLIRTLGEVGVFADGSHCSRRTGLDIAEVSGGPMIYSHSNFAALWPHPRNITDDQARACAASGGVIGINGVGIFLGRNRVEGRAARIEAMADHIAYGAELVGVEHIGIGSDFSFDGDQFNAEIAAAPENFSEDYTRWGPLQWVPPEDLLGIDREGAGNSVDMAGVPSLDDALARKGFTEAERVKIFRGNFARVAREVWK